MPYVRRPKLDEVIRLSQCRLFVCANPLDPLWDGDQEFDNRAFYPNHDDQGVISLPDLSLTYWPKYAKDWKGHPHVLRTLEFIRYYPRSRMRGFVLNIQPIPPGRHFLMVPKDWGRKILKGEATAADLYAWLVEHHPSMS